MITLDTSGMFALLDRKEKNHPAAKRDLLADPGPYLVPAGTLCELGYLVMRRLGRPVLDAVLADIESGSFVLDCGEDDLPRVRELLERYEDIGLDFTDAAVIACAERSGGRVLTFDRRDFDIVARESKITILPA